MTATGDRTEIFKAAQAGNVAAQFDAATIMMQESEKRTTPTWNRPLPLCEPKRRIFPNTHRSIDRIDAGLRSTLRDLASGAKPWPLFLWGTAGGGKTLASLCLADITKMAVYAQPDDLADLIMGPDNADAVFRLE